MLVSFIIITILQLHPVVWCRPIPITEPAHTPKTYVKDRCIVDTNNNNEKSVGEAVKMAYPPEGTGLFRDPLEVLGPMFPTKKAINTCEMHVSLVADSISDIRFTKRGENMCVELCSQYRTNMITDGPVDVTLLQGYCNYSNSVDSIENLDLATTCTCAYRVRCNNKSSMIMYSFQANCKGFIKVSVSEPNKSMPIT
ncbi:uncharacterized protein LOC112688260 [Sipha flava]|uniref:Uncharacterized protein LOC112688260 n=2 Tax=Sipha flava TaxID=143950 RepID=A0A8B8G3A6_9HEMI|nr:uncharacterized protein LOC112688260 [Sipha flava]